MPRYSIAELDRFLASLADPVVRHRYQANLNRLRDDMKRSALRDDSSMAADEAAGLLALYMQADAANGNPARIAGALQKLRRRFPESEELYDELFETLTNADLAMPAALPMPVAPAALPSRPQPASDEPWSVRLRNRMFGSVPAFIVRLSDALVEALATPAPALQPVLVRSDADDWDADLLTPVLAQEVTLEGRNYFAELFARHSTTSLQLLAGLTGDEPLPAEALVHLRIGRTSRTARFAHDGKADLGALPFDLLSKGARANPIELVFELPYSGTR